MERFPVLCQLLVFPPAGLNRPCSYVGPTMPDEKWYDLCNFSSLSLYTQISANFSRLDLWLRQWCQNFRNILKLKIWKKKYFFFSSGITFRRGGNYGNTAFLTLTNLNRWQHCHCWLFPVLWQTAAIVARSICDCKQQSQTIVPIGTFTCAHMVCGKGPRASWYASCCCCCSNHWLTPVSVLTHGSRLDCSERHHYHHVCAVGKLGV